MGKKTKQSQVKLVLGLADRICDYDLVSAYWQIDPGSYLFIWFTDQTQNQILKLISKLIPYVTTTALHNN